MSKKPRLYIKDGRWDWYPDIMGPCTKGTPNFEACMWCLNQNIKEGR